MKTLMTLAALGTFLSISKPATAASFECDEPRIAAERTICNHTGLSALDERLAYWYGRAKVRAGYFDQTGWLVGGQRAWLAERNACGSSVFCLRAKYHHRIRRLKNYAEHV